MKICVRKIEPLTPGNGVPPITRFLISAYEPDDHVEGTFVQSQSEVVLNHLYQVELPDDASAFGSEPNAISFVDTKTGEKLHGTLIGKGGFASVERIYSTVVLPFMDETTGEEIPGVMLVFDPEISQAVFVPREDPNE